MKLHVSNLPVAITEAKLLELFQAHGEIASVVVIRNKKTGISKEYGFVEMPKRAEAKAAITRLNEQKLDENIIVVTEALPTTKAASSKKKGASEEVKPIILQKNKNKKKSKSRNKGKPKTGKKIQADNFEREGRAAGARDKDTQPSGKSRGGESRPTDRNRGDVNRSPGGYRGY
ncbi:hypothetical protein KAR34_07225, partial [bacterium]|nr:hypothetical protein [bacterium]